MKGVDYMEYYSAIKKRSAICSNMMDLEIITLSEVRKRETNNICYHLYAESNIWHKWTFYKTETDSQA